MISLLLFVAPAFSQASIALPIGVQRVPEVVQMLASSSHEPLTSAVNLKNEVLYVNLKAKPLKELMGLVAEASGCEWVQRDGRVELTKTSTKLREDELIDRAFDIACINDVIKYFPAPTDRLTDSNADAVVEQVKKLMTGSRESFSKRASDINELRPIVRFIRSCLHTKSPDWIVSTPIGKTATYSDPPTRAQRPLPFSLGQLFRTYVSEETAMLKALNKIEGDPMSLKADILGYSNGLTVNDLKGELRPVISVRRQSAYFIEVDLRVFDKDGKEFAQASIGSDLTSDNDKIDIEKDAKSAHFESHPAILALKSKWLHPSKDREIIQIYREPLVNEPLKISVESPLNALAKSTQAEVIFSLPDSLAAPNESLSLDGQTMGEFFSYLKFGMNMQWRGKLLFGRPRQPFFAWQSRADRTLMQDLIRKVPFSYPVSLDNLSAYIGKQSELAGCLFFEKNWLTLAIHGKDSSDDLKDMFSVLGQRDWLRLWSTLSPNQRKSLRETGLLSVDGLSSASRNILHTSIYDRSSLLKIGETGLSRLPISIVLPNGIPNNAYIEAKITPKPYVICETKEGFHDFWEASTAGYIVSQQEKGNFPSERGYLPLVDAQYRPVSGEEWVLGVKLTPELLVQAYLKDFGYNPSVKAKPAETLEGPSGEGFRKTLEYYRRLGD